MSDRWLTLALVIGCVAIGIVIGLGHVMKESSYGLDIILLGLANALNNLTKDGGKKESGI